MHVCLNGAFYGLDSMEPMEELRGLIDRHAKMQKQPTILGGLTIYKVERPTLPTESVYSPRLCVVVQGAKAISLGGRTFDVDDRQYFIATVDLPVSASIARATDEAPHLAFTLDLERDEIAAILPDMAPLETTSRDTGFAVSQHSNEILQASLRLIGLLDRPDDIAVMATLIKRELYYRLLQGEHGALLRQFATHGTNLAQIGRASNWIKEHFEEPMSIKMLAEIAGMSVTSFHRHFRAVTLMTPLQYRALIRLQEARKRLLLNNTNARIVGFEVGYDSQTQFTREYRRLFGRPPAADAFALGRDANRPGRKSTGHQSE